MDRLWIQRGDSGAGVRRWQELLLEAGYSLPLWGTDGGFGEETETATIQAQTDLRAAGLYSGAIDAKVGDATLGAMSERLKKQPQSERLSIVDGVEVHDYRGMFDPPKNGKPEWGSRWPKLTGVVLHRTACRMGERPQRYAAMNAHIAVTLEGRIILVHPWDLHIWHGHHPSLWTIGIEFDGNPEGMPGYWWKPGGGPDPITSMQVAASKVLLKLLREAFEEKRQPFKYIYAHRQSSDQRECDPGWMCWQEVAIPWMDSTGATPGDIGLQGTTFGTGFHIPQSWDPRSPVKGFREN